MSDKSELRDFFRQRRALISAEARIHHARSLARWFAAEQAFMRQDIIAAYAALPEEADLGDLIEFLFSEGKKILLPKTHENKTLTFVSYRKEENLVEGRFGIKEPAASISIIPQLVLIPLLAWDAEGYRLGYGGGYYDRTLAQPAFAGALKVGVGFALQRHEALPRAAHDVKLDALLTEEGVTWF